MLILLELRSQFNVIKRKKDSIQTITLNGSNFKAKQSNNG